MLPLVLALPMLIPKLEPLTSTVMFPVLVMAFAFRSNVPPSCGVVSSTTLASPPPPVAVIVSVSVFWSVAILMPLPASM